MKAQLFAIGLIAFVGACSPAEDTEAASPEQPQTEEIQVASETASAEFSTEALVAAPAGTYSLDKGHGYITFTYDHQGYSKPWVRWGDWESTLTWNPDDPEASSVSATIKAASVDSNVDKFDDHMKSADMFDVEKYPSVGFQSTSVTRTGVDTGTIVGNLTLMGMTKPVTLDVTFNKAGTTRGGGHKVGFSATTDLVRSEWGLGYAVPHVGDDVTIIIEAEYEKAGE
ncbi:MAG: YceI family protein [Hellea sp.]|nr:YceI family protein [Hellea sp.]